MTPEIPSKLTWIGKDEAELTDQDLGNMADFEALTNAEIILLPLERGRHPYRTGVRDDRPAT